MRRWQVPRRGGGRRSGSAPAGFVFEWIDDGDSRSLHVINVAGNERKPVHDRGRRQHRIDHGQRIGNHQPPPRFSDWFVHVEDARRVVGAKLREPDVELQGRSLVPSPNGFDSAPYLSYGENAQELLFPRGRSEPVQDSRVSSRALPQLRENVRIEEVAQSETFRPVSLGRSKSRSSPTFGISNRSASNEAASPAPCNACLKISRCSASAERPCCAARTFKSRTRPSSMFRTMSWATFVLAI